MNPDERVQPQSTLQEPAPGVAPTEEYQSITPALPPKHGGKKGLWICAIVVVLLLVGAGISKAEYGTFLPPAIYNLLPGFAQSNDADLFYKMIGNLASIKTSESNTTITLSTEPYDGSPRITDLSAEVSDSYPDYDMGAIPDYAININANLKTLMDDEYIGNELATHINLDLDMGGMMVQMEADIIVTDGVIYIRPVKFPSIFADITPLLSKWVRYDFKEQLQDMGATYEQFTQAFTSGSNEVTSVEDNLEFISGPDGEKFLDDALAIMIDERIISVEVVSDSAASISGAVNYRLSIDGPALISAVDKFMDLMVSIEMDGSESAQEKEMIAEMAEIYKQEFISPEVIRMIDYLNSATTFNVWVDKVTALPKKAEFSYNLAFPEPEDSSIADKMFRTKISSEFVSINKALDITAPAESIEIEDAIELMFGSGGGVVSASLNSARAKGTDAGTKSNLNMIRTQAEIYYDSFRNYGPPATSCKSGMFANDETMKRIIESIEVSESLKPVEVTCRSGNNWYAVSASLISKPGVSWCVDSTGVATEGIIRESGSRYLCQ